jgi:hypothetical protein
MQTRGGFPLKFASELVRVTGQVGPHMSGQRVSRDSG